MAGAKTRDLAVPEGVVWDRSRWGIGMFPWGDRMGCRTWALFGDIRYGNIGLVESVGTLGCGASTSMPPLGKNLRSSPVAVFGTSGFRDWCYDLVLRQGFLRKTYSHHRFDRGDTNFRRRKPLAMTLATWKRVYSSDRLLLMRNLRETTQLSLLRCPRKLLFVRLRIGMVPDMGSINLLAYHPNCLLQLNSCYMSSKLRISHAVKRPNVIRTISVAMEREIMLVDIIHQGIIFLVEDRVLVVSCLLSVV